MPSSDLFSIVADVMPDPCVPINPSLGWRCMNEKHLKVDDDSEISRYFYMVRCFLVGCANYVYICCKGGGWGTDGLFVLISFSTWFLNTGSL